MTPAAGHVGHLDGWRGLAIALVLQSHFLPLHGLDTGRLGVDLFFVLSGMLMADILFRQRMPVVRFVKRRVSRILPAFLVFVGTVFLVGHLHGLRPGGVELGATLTFLRTYVPASPDIWHAELPIKHLWSLNVEEHSYLLLALVATLPGLQRRAVWWLGAAFVASLAVNLHYSRSGLMTNGSSYELRSEVAGAFIVASAAYRLVADRVAGSVRPWMPPAALALALLGYGHAPHWWMSDALAPLALAFAVNHLGRTWPALRGALETRPMRRLGLWSFSIYLWQQPFFEFSRTLPPALCLAGALAAGLLSFHLVEMPARHWLNQHW